MSGVEKGDFPENSVSSLQLLHHHLCDTAKSQTEFSFCLQLNETIKLLKVTLQEVCR